MWLEKIYKVTFMRYTNSLSDTVSDWDGKSSFSGREEYLHVGRESFLVRESELEIYRKYGGGYRDVIFVGNMPVAEAVKSKTPIYGDEVIDPHSTGNPLKDYNRTTSTPLKDPSIIVTCQNTSVGCATDVD